MKTRHRHFKPHAHAAWLLAFGLFAVALHAFASVDPLRRSSAASAAMLPTNAGIAVAPVPIFRLFRYFLRSIGMIELPGMLYQSGFSRTRRGTAYGSDHPGEDFGA
jgi:cbb3-type cytochrome oxidase subunit 3